MVKAQDIRKGDVLYDADGTVVWVAATDARSHQEFNGKWFVRFDVRLRSSRGGWSSAQRVFDPEQLIDLGAPR